MKAHLMPNPEAIDLLGRALLPNGTEEACAIRCRDPDTMELVLASTVQPGIRLLCHVESLGVIEGIVAENTPGGRCLIHVQATTAHLSRLGARLACRRRRATEAGRARDHDGVIPRFNTVRVRTETGSDTTGILLSLSMTEATVRLTTHVEIGTTLAIGRRRATVVRYTDDGLAARFFLPLRPEDVTPDIVW